MIKGPWVLRKPPTELFSRYVVARDPVGIIPLYIGWCAGKSWSWRDHQYSESQGRFSASSHGGLKTLMSTQNGWQESVYWMDLRLQHFIDLRYTREWLSLMWVYPCRGSDGSVQVASELKALHKALYRCHAWWTSSVHLWVVKQDVFVAMYLDSRLEHSF